MSVWRNCPRGAIRANTSRSLREGSTRSLLRAFDMHGIKVLKRFQLDFLQCLFRCPLFLALGLQWVISYFYCWGRTGELQWTRVLFSLVFKFQTSAACSFSYLACTRHMRGANALLLAGSFSLQNRSWGIGLLHHDCDTFEFCIFNGDSIPKHFLHRILDGKIDEGLLVVEVPYSSWSSMLLKRLVTLRILSTNLCSEKFIVSNESKNIAPHLSWSYLILSWYTAAILTMTEKMRGKLSA